MTACYSDESSGLAACARIDPRMFEGAIAANCPAVAAVGVFTVWISRPFNLLRACLLNLEPQSEKRGVQAARNGPSPPSCVAKPQISTADRLGSFAVFPTAERFRSNRD